MKRALILWLLAATIAGVGLAQPGDPANVHLKTSKVAGSVSMIEGADGFAGGNVGVSEGDDGVFLIDDELAPLTPKLKAALAALSKKPLRFVFNTHWHGDHTGGNESFGAGGALIVAHDNVRQRLGTDQVVEMMGPKRTIPASPAKALPVVTFSSEVTFHLNGDEIHVFHVPHAHTDGDSIVHFKKANVIHMGDTFMSAGFPVIDAGSGGSLEGFVTAADRTLAVSDAATRIIPGHGPVADRARLQVWRDMLVKIRDRLAALRAAKKTVEDAKASKPTAEFDKEWGGGFIKPDMLIEAAWKAAPEPAPAAPAGPRAKGRARP